MKQEDLLWKYAEGQCSPEESAQVEKLLTKEPRLKGELDLLMEVQSSLSQIETAGPSMRFTQNVMEALPPKLYPPLSVESLVGSIWKKIFAGSLALCTLAAVFSLFGESTSGGSLITPYTAEAVDKVNGIVSAVPSAAAQFFVLTLLSIMTLVLVDKFFLRRTKAAD